MPSTPSLHTRCRLTKTSHRLDTVDCSQRESPASTAGGQGDGGEGVEDDDMGDFMAEILAEEVSQ